MQRCFLQVAIALGCSWCVFAQTKPAADLIIQNARVWTVDPSRPEAEAVAGLGGRIVALGSSQQGDPRPRAPTRPLEAGGERRLPGLHRAHPAVMGRRGPSY